MSFLRGWVLPWMPLPSPRLFFFFCEEFEGPFGAEEASIRFDPYFRAEEFDRPPYHELRSHLGERGAEESSIRFDRLFGAAPWVLDPSRISTF